MNTATIQKSNLSGALCAFMAALCFSLNDVGFKFLSDQYALHQIVLLRAMVGLAVLLLMIMPFSGGWQIIRTRKLGWHLVRGLCVVLANTFLFLGLAAMPIADAVAVFFVSPLVITVFSILFLGEMVGVRRWSAIIVGFIGVMVIVKPGTSAFQLASLFPMAAAVLYAVMNIVARRIGSTESAATMTFYIVISFITVSIAMGLTVGDGRFAGMDNASLDFLLRAWGPIGGADIPIIIILGLSGVLGGFLINQAYRLSEAAFAAPFEYVSMPMAIMWGITLFGTWPDRTAWVGIVLILGSGLYLVWRESRKNHQVTTPLPGHER